MTFHYDYITKHFAEKRELVEKLTQIYREQPEVGFDELGFALEKHGFFPAACITLALMTLHNDQGQQTFIVGEHLASMLEHTTLEDIPKNELRMPYPIFYVALPGCKHRVWGGTRTGWHDVEGMYVYLSDEVFTIMAWAGENEHALGVGDDAHIWVRMKMRREHDEDLETMIHRLLTSRDNERNDPIIDPVAFIEGSQDNGIDDAVQAVQVQTLTAMYRIAVNLALYLSTPEPEAEPEIDERAKTIKQKLKRAKASGQRKKLQRQLDNRSKATVVRVGRSIEAKVASQVREHGSVKAHWVRGHFHHYWTGKGRTIKIRKWIMPYPKGLEPPPQRSYQVQDDSPNDSPEGAP